MRFWIAGAICYPPLGRAANGRALRHVARKPLQASFLACIVTLGGGKSKSTVGRIREKRGKKWKKQVERKGKEKRENKTEREILDKEEENNYNGIRRKSVELEKAKR